MLDTAMTCDDAQRTMKNNERNFQAGDLTAIMAGYTEDVVVRYADFPEMRGKAALEEFLKARFHRMQGYRLVKTLQAVDGSTFVNSWDASWTDRTNGNRMQARGIEVSRMTDSNLCSQWDATVNVWVEGAPGSLPIV